MGAGMPAPTVSSARPKGRLRMLRFVVRRLLLLDPDPARALDPRLRLDQGAAGQPGAGAPRRARDARHDRADQPSVRARQADLRAVLEVPRADGAAEPRHVDHDAPDGPHRDRPALPGHGRARDRRGDLLGRRSASRSASSRRSATARVRPRVSLAISLLGISIPIFFLALILKYIFAVRLGWLPSVGAGSRC